MQWVQIRSVQPEWQDDQSAQISGVDCLEKHTQAEIVRRADTRWIDPASSA
jgi:hypothetical protein